MMTKLTKAQAEALRAYAKRTSPDSWDGSSMVILLAGIRWARPIQHALRDKGLLEQHAAPYLGLYRITPAGRAALAAYDEAAT